MPHEPRARPRRRCTRAARPRSSRRSRPPPRRWQRLVADAVGGARRDLPARRRAARRAVARDAQRRDDARPVEDRAPGRDRRRLRADRLLALQRRVHDADLRRAAGLRRPASGTAWSTGRSRASSSRSRRSTSPSIGGNLPTAPALMGNTVVWKPASTAAYSALLPDEAARGGRPAAGRDQLRLRRRRARSATPRSRTATSPASTSPARPPSSTTMWKTIGRTSLRRLPQLSAHRRRDRRQGLHRRAPVRRRGRARDGDRPRRVRVPGAEVLGRVARLRAVAVARAARAARRGGRDAARWATSRDFSNFMGAVIDERLVRDAARGDRGGEGVDGATSVLVGGGYDDSEGYFVEPTVVETTRPRLPHDARGALRAGRDRVRLRRERATTRRSSWSTRTRPYALTGAVFARDRDAIEQAQRARCATRPATSTSTTSRPARSSGSSRSAARARRARTTRPARCGT